MILGDGRENGATVNRSENGSGDGIARNKGKSIVRNNSPLSDLCR